MRVWTAAIIQESNTFSPRRSEILDFRSHHYVFGEEEIRKVQTENELNGFYAAAEAAGLETIPAISANAVSSGMLSAEAWQEWQAIFAKSAAAAGACDGVYLALHGAMAAEGCGDTEGELLAIARRQFGEGVPIVVSLDLHANVTRRMTKLADGIVGFRTYPHTDFAETGQRAASLMLRLLRGNTKLHVAYRKLPMIVPAENSQTSHGPFADLWKAAKAGERRGASLCTSLFPVQPWLDVEELGFSVTVVGQDRDQAEREADRLADLAWEMKHRFDIRLYSMAEIVDIIRKDPCAPREPLVISDSADSPSAGSTGDSNAVLKSLLEHGLHETLNGLLTIVDAPAVQTAIETGVGQTVELTLGYTLNHNRSHGEPIRISGSVRRIGDGKFMLGGGYAKNTEANMGRCVVLEIGRLSVLIAEKPTFSGDPAMYRSMGLEPTEADLVLVKSANQFRQDYGPLTRRIYMLDTPGYSTANLRSLTFRQLQRPFYPFDDEFDWRFYS